MDEFNKHNWANCVFPTAYLASVFVYATGFPFKKGLEIGFDAGCSALAALRGAPNATLLSIDIAPCEVGRNLIANSEVQDRHTFIQADSREWLHAAVERGEKYDWIYVDGDHLYDVVKFDIEMAVKLLEEGGRIIVDDADPSHAHFGCGRAAREVAAEHGFVVEELLGSPNGAVVLRKP